MGYRLVVAVLSLVFFCSCAAFDSDSDAVEGFGPEKDRPGNPSVSAPAGELSGYYAGTMVLGSNACESISDEVGVESEFSVEVVQVDDKLSATFPGDIETGGKLADDKATFVTDVMSVKHVYYFTFAEEAITGSAEVVEADADGDFGEPCASYTLDLKKGEKPAEDAKGTEGEDAEEDGSGEEETEE